MSATASSTAAALYARLTGSAGVTAIAGDRIFPLTGSEGVTAPHIVWQAIYADPAASLTWATGSAIRMYQISCYAPGAAVALALRQAVIDALDGVALSTGDIPTLADERDTYEDAVRLYRADADFTI
jgi:hypothetical protein